MEYEIHKRGMKIKPEPGFPPADVGAWLNELVDKLGGLQPGKHVWIELGYEKDLTAEQVIIFEGIIKECKTRGLILKVESASPQTVRLFDRLGWSTLLA